MGVVKVLFKYLINQVSSSIGKQSKFINKAVGGASDGAGAPKATRNERTLS